MVIESQSLHPNLTLIFTMKYISFEIVLPLRHCYIFIVCCDILLRAKQTSFSCNLRFVSTNIGSSPSLLEGQQLWCGVLKS